MLITLMLAFETSQALLVALKKTSETAWPAAIVTPLATGIVKLTPELNSLLSCLALPVSSRPVAVTSRIDATRR
eukprot:tig00021439_g21461.t1